MSLGPTCRSCKAPVRWVLTVKRRNMPLDPNPVHDGTFVIDMVNGVEIARRPGDDEETFQKRYNSHFATCPYADAHRRSR